MIRKLLLLLFSVILFYNNCNAQHFWKNYPIKNKYEMSEQTIHFRFAQFRLDCLDYPTIKKVAKFMENNKHIKIKLYGFISKKEANYVLAERRLNAVYESLSNFGIDVKNRVELCVKGLKNQPYDKDSYNQCVIIKKI